MPVRLLREGILDSEKVCSLSWEAEVFYRRLMSVVDDYGRFDGRVLVLRSRLYPLQTGKVREADLERLISECEKAGLIRIFSSNAKQYILFHNVDEPRAKESKYPPPPPDVLEDLAKAGISVHLTEQECQCEHLKAYANRRNQTPASVPYSDAYSKNTAGDSRTAKTKAPKPKRPPTVGELEELGLV
jgi:hypothetical protein